jgi:phosphatidylserine/phosphatidylglycerophosphate/cardiolipin synthase-like enzyme
MAAEREVSQQAADRLQLVWTGPDVPGSVNRDTGVVVRELLSSAKYSLLLSTFTIRRGREVFAPLAAAIQENPAVRVRLIVNIGRNGDYGPSEQQLLDRFATDFWTEHWPWSQRPLTYYDPRALSLDRSVTASLHAKCIVVDDEIAFVTSANFTEWAQERNVEAGVLIRDENFARTLRQQFDALIGASRLRLLPGSAGY